MRHSWLFAPVLDKGRWLVDGGLIDPVPVGVARAMGADIVIAVDLNNRLVSRRTRSLRMRDNISQKNEQLKSTDDRASHRYELVKKMTDYYENAGNSFRHKTYELLRRESASPDIVETVMTSIGIMQERITRINLAVDRPDILIQPRLGELKMMNFDHVEHAIEEGYIETKEKIEDIRILLASD